MANEDIRNQVTRRWLEKACRDLRAATALIALPEPLLDVVVYHCQQAAEKALKGFLVWHDEPFGKRTTCDRCLCNASPLIHRWRRLHQLSNSCRRLRLNFVIRRVWFNQNSA